MGEKNYKLKSDAMTTIADIRTKDMYVLSVLPKDTVSSMMLIELATTALVDFDKEIHLIGGISRFMQSIKKQKVFKTWNFRYSLEGDRYWFHNGEEKAYRHFPYTKSLFRFIQNKRLRTEKKSLKRVRTYAERHPLFVKYGAGFAQRISEIAISMMSRYLEEYLEDPKAEKPCIDLSGLREEFELQGEDGLTLLFTDPYRLSNQNVFLDRDDKDVRLSTDSETEKEGGTTVSWETVRRLVFDKDNKPSSSIFQNKKLFKAKVEVKRRVQRSNTFKDLNPEKTFPVSFFDIKRKRSRKSQELLLTDQQQEEFANITESSSEDEDSSADFESEDYEGSSNRKQEDTPRGTNITKSDSIKQVQFADEVGGEEDGRKEKRTNTVKSGRGDRTDSANDAGRQSSHEGKSGISSRASKRQPQSRNTSRPGTGNVLMPGAQPILPQVRKEMSHHRAHLPDNERSKTELQVANGGEFMYASQRSSVEEAGGATPIFDGKRLPGLIPIQSPIHELSASQIDLKASASLIAISSPRSRNEGRAGILPQFPLPPIQLETVGENQPRLAGERSEQAVRDKVAREHFGKFGDAVVSSFFDHVTQSPDQSPSDPSLLEVRETEEHDSEVTSWLSSKEVVAGLGHLLMPILKDKVATLARSDPTSVMDMARSPRTLPPIVLQKGGETPTGETIIQLQRKSAIVPSTRRDSYLISEGMLVKSQAVSSNKRNSILIQHSLSPVEDPKGGGLPQSFVLSPNLRTPAQVFVNPPKHVVSPQVVRIHNFLHYLEKVGFPLSTNSEVCHYPVTQEILPQHVRKMGKRLGMRVSAQKYNSAESDLLWIALLQLTAPAPHSFRSSLPGQVVMLPFKSHPGDEYFHLMTIFNRKLRAQELDKMVKGEKVKNLLDESWLCLVTRMNSPYLYNFLTGERINLKSQPYREKPDLNKDVRIAEMKRMLENQLEEENA